MYNFLQDLLEEVKDYPVFGEITKTPASADLFNEDNDSSKLSPDRAEKLHHILEQLLFSSKRTRPRHPSYHRISFTQVNYQRYQTTTN